MSAATSTLSRVERTIVPVASAARWYAVWTRNQCEEKVEAQLRRKQFETFLPLVKAPSRRRDRRKILDVPLFPGYLFLRFEPEKRAFLKAVNTEGVVRILGESWDRLHTLQDDTVEAVRRLVSESNGARCVPWIRVGDRVRIASGPLAGLEGFVQSWRAGRATFVVSVDLLQRSVGVEVLGEILERVN